MHIKKLLVLLATAAGVSIGLLSPNVAAYGTPVAPAGQTVYSVQINVFKSGTVYCGEFKGTITIDTKLVGQNYETVVFTAGTIYARCGGRSTFYAWRTCGNSSPIRYGPTPPDSTTSSKNVSYAGAQCSYGVTAWDELCWIRTGVGSGCANSQAFGGAPINGPIRTVAKRSGAAG
jgi:hypothetical protein